MKWRQRYMLMNGGELMLLRKFFGCWWEYRPHSNLLHAKYDEVNKLYRKLEKLNEEIKDLKALEYRERQRIEGAREHPKGYGPVLPEKIKLPLFPFRVKATTMTDFSFEKLLALFKGRGKSMAQEIAELSGVQIVGVDGHSVSGRVTEMTDDPAELCGERSHEIKPESRNQQRKKGQPNNGSQQ